MKNILKTIALATLVASVAPVYTAENNDEKANMPVAWAFTMLQIPLTVLGLADIVGIIPKIGSDIYLGKAPVAVAFAFTAIAIPLALLPATLVGAACKICCKTFCNTKTFEEFKNIDNSINNLVGDALGVITIVGAGHYIMSHMYRYN